MQLWFITTALLTFLTSILAAPACPTIPHDDPKNCLVPDMQICVDLYADDQFHGDKWEGQCHGQAECVNIPENSPVFGKVSSFKGQGVKGLDDKETKYKGMVCQGWVGKDCKGTSGMIARYTPSMVTSAIMFNDMMVSYKCWAAQGR